ncbi:5115_t:CDS:2 [Racocetra persica]|uniref:5115_t:CDS:1 n=1 Tax=Racocetra persica TaxID=160502 RepID=A0ACA9ND30_9GLOM|nr:5115_t:CDS:2 [Racocetra persica]
MSNIRNENSVPFIPLYLRNSPLDIYNSTLDIPILLPTKFNKKDRARCVRVLDDELSIQHTGVGASSIRANNPIPHRAGIYYFEIDLLNEPASIGVARKGFNLEGHSGWEFNSVGYHGDDGLIYCERGYGISYGPTFSTGDTIGCCLNYYDQIIFFTKNGINLGIASTSIFTGDLYPIVGIQTRFSHVEINFGTRPFKFDIEFYAKAIFQQNPMFTFNEFDEYYEDEYESSDYF